MNLLVACLLQRPKVFFFLFKPLNSRIQVNYVRPIMILCILCRNIGGFGTVKKESGRGEDGPV